MHSKEEKYLKVIESIGELLLNKDSKIQINEYEIKSLKKKIENIEKYIEYYTELSDDVTNEDYERLTK